MSRSSLSTAEIFQQGVKHHRAGDLQQAEVHYRQVLASDPAHADSLHLLGTIALRAGRADLAIGYISSAIKRQPLTAQYHYNLGNAFLAEDRLTKAEACYREALRLKPDYVIAHNNLGNILRDSGRLDEAEACYRAALNLQADFPDAHNNLGSVFATLFRLPEAETCYREALRLKPDYGDAHTNLGIVFSYLGDVAQAEACHRAALAINPRDAEAHSNLAYALCLAGRLDEAWPEYEWRWRTKLYSRHRRNFAQPLWNGEVIDNRVILLHAEQGFGDTLQFCRYVPLVAATGARIVLEAPRPLARLLAGLPGIERFVKQGDPLPSFDYHCPLMSLPRAFGTTPGAIPAVIPYLRADAALAAYWRERLAGLGGLRVGLAWAGDPRPGSAWANAIDRRRSITLGHFAPLAKVAGCSFISLQKGAASAQTASPPPGMEIHDWTGELDDFADTAALIETLDLVICVDTAIVHLAGALGRPVWLLNRFDTCWRWLLDREDSPWYPTLRQFRQPKPGDWDSVIAKVCEELCRAAALR